MVMDMVNLLCRLNTATAVWRRHAGAAATTIIWSR